MNALGDVMAAAAEVEGFCRQQGWHFCIIGGIAVQRWGKPRFTQDVDLMLLTGPGLEGAFVESILRRFPGRLANARQFALQHRVLLARSIGGVHIDFSLGALPFEEASIARASLWTVSEFSSLTTCSAEDLVVHKAFASRDRDWSDVETILVRQHGRLDLAQIRRDLSPLLELKEDEESFAKLERLVVTVDKRLGE